MCCPKLERVRCRALILASVIRRRRTGWKSNVSGSGQTTRCQEMAWCNYRRRSKARRNKLAQPIPLEIPPRNVRAELQSRLEQAPAEHAEALLSTYEVLQELHNRGV